MVKVNYQGDAQWTNSLVAAAEGGNVNALVEALQVPTDPNLARAEDGANPWG